MDKTFRQLIESLDTSFHRLMDMTPVTVAALPADMPQSGIYLFSDEVQNLEVQNLYVGRTNNIRERLYSQCRRSSNHNSATFAFRLAREITGQKIPTYIPDGSRSWLENDPIFGKIFVQQKARVRNMHVRYVSEPDPIKQALLEIYVSVALQTPHNNFDNN